MNGGHGGRAGTAVVTGNEHNLRAGLCHAAGDRADSGLRNQLNADARMPVSIFQIKNKLCQVLNGINVVMRRRADQRDTRRGAACVCDPGVYLTAGQMPAFAGLGALCHFDLQLLGAVEVGACYAETAGSNLLDSRAAQRIVQPVRGLTALTRVGLTAQGIHCHGKALMGLLGNGAVAHGPSPDCPP